MNSVGVLIEFPPLPEQLSMVYSALAAIATTGSISYHCEQGGKALQVKLWDGVILTPQQLVLTAVSTLLSNGSISLRI